MGRTKTRYREWQKEMREKGKYNNYRRAYRHWEGIRPGRLAAYYCPHTDTYKEVRGGWKIRK